MIKLVRGGAVFLVLSMFVALVYAQTTGTENDLSMTKDIQEQTDQTTTSGPDSSKENALNPTPNNDDTAKTKKLVKTTGSVRAAGASRGAFTATAYCLSGKTAMGHSVRRGIIAADPRVLKLGSTVNIAAGPYSGTYLVSDTGGAVKGRKIDIWMPSCSEARRFGRRSVEIFSPI